MNHISPIETSSDIARYARCIETSKRVRWDIDKDVIQGRTFDTAQKYLPDGLSKAEIFETLSDDEKRYLSQIQGRTYANMFGLVERFINAKVLDISRDHWLGHQTKLEALIRAFDDQNQPYTSLNLPMWTNRYGAYDDLARIKEWSAAGGLGIEEW